MRACTRAALAALLMLAVAAVSSDKPQEPFVYLIVPESCVDEYTALLTKFRLPSDLSCAKRTIAKTLGYAIITGASVVKVPQILRFLDAKSVKGVSLTATYFDTVAYVIVSAYHVVRGSPWSAYGENVVIFLQSLVIIGIMWSYHWPGTTHAVAVAVACAAIANVCASVPAPYLPALQWTTVALFAVSRSWQILVNAQQGHTGELAFLTLFMNFAGASARVFTSLTEAPALEVVVAAASSALLNGLLVAQYVVYTMLMRRRPGAPDVATTESAAPAPAPVRTQPDAQVAEAVISDKGPNSSGGGRVSQRKKQRE